jgi:hypothetical protein
MLTLTTTEPQALVVAAYGGPVPSAPPAVAVDHASCMRLAIAGRSRSTDRRTKPAVFGTWNPPRRLVGFVT